ncbi:hypothetical protein NL676_008202 [Syzygium grande]|nr:hypothetical protein NL676_008202 [Syzygium grande]
MVHVGYVGKGMEMDLVLPGAERVLMWWIWSPYKICPNLVQNRSPSCVAITPGMGTRSSARITNWSRPQCKDLYAMAVREIENAPELSQYDFSVTMSGEERIDLAVLAMYDFDVIMGMD